MSSFATLRKLLLLPPSQKLWSDIIDLFVSWEDEREREQALRYAEEHMTTWPDELRMSYVGWHSKQGYAPDPNAHCYAPLVRALETECSLRGLDPSFFYSLPLEKITHLTIDPDDMYLPEPEQLSRFEKLRCLTIDEFEWTSLDGFGFPESIEELTLQWCGGLSSFEGGKKLKKLRLLRLEGIEEIENLDFLVDFPDLEQLCFGDSGNSRKWSSGCTLHDLDGLKFCPKLHTLSFDDRMLKINNYDGIMQLEHLQKLDFHMYNSPFIDLSVQELRRAEDFRFEGEKQVRVFRERLLSLHEGG